MLLLQALSNERKRARSICTHALGSVLSAGCKLKLTVNITTVGKIQVAAGQDNRRRKLHVYMDLERHPKWAGEAQGVL